ncbi:Uncharacterized protein DAT39_002869 [Clarias magur]|uniref:Uncharacterized protein n=1 Tax=Clarias magur TaxID=1594786 RepID=A0A8J4XG72_CLAMG|nr:Uncharacterized protein DAT39_002869 [Clarias magur]
MCHLHFSPNSYYPMDKASLLYCDSEASFLKLISLVKNTQVLPATLITEICTCIVLLRHTRTHFLCVSVKPASTGRWVSSQRVPQLRSAEMRADKDKVGASMLGNMSHIRAIRRGVTAHPKHLRFIRNKRRQAPPPA